MLLKGKRYVQCESINFSPAGRHRPTCFERSLRGNRRCLVDWRNGGNRREEVNLNGRKDDATSCAAGLSRNVDRSFQFGAADDFRVNLGRSEGASNGWIPSIIVDLGGPGTSEGEYFGDVV